MNADLALARLAEVAAAHDCHARDGDRHCLSSGDAALIHASTAATAGPFNTGVYDRSHPVSAHPDALSATLTRWSPAQTQGAHLQSERDL